MKPKSLCRWGWATAVMALGVCWVASGVLAATNKVPQRSEIADQYKWKLEDMYVDLAAWEKDFKSVEENIPRFAGYQGRLGESPQVFLECMKLYEQVSITYDKLSSYAGLKLDEDNRVSEYQELYGRASALGSKLNEATSFIDPELLGVAPEKLEAILKSGSEGAVYRFYLENLLRQKEHVLPADQEALMALAGPVLKGPSDIFGMMDNADITFGTVYDEDSNEVELTSERYSACLDSPSRRVRRDALRVYNEAYAKWVNSMAASLAASVKADYFRMKARGYKSCLEMSLDDYNIPTSVYHNLISAVNANLTPLQKWAKLRKRLLKVDTLYHYDMYCPLVPRVQKEYTYEQALDMVVKGLEPMGKTYMADFQKGLNSRWIDVYETEGKGGGGYTLGTYACHPFILLNFNGTLDWVFTIAHEMGHAMNDYYVYRTEPFIYSNYSLFTAEVASSCDEAVVLKYLLKNTTDKREKAALLDYYLVGMYGAFFRQVMFSEFELAIHTHIEEGGAFSADYFRKTYRDIYQKYFGNEIVIDSLTDMGGLRVGHFYRQYYVYQYATCYAASQMMSQKILDGDKGYLDRYMKFLATGDSKYPVDILKDAGVDMTTPEPIDRTLKLFGELVDELDRLTSE